MPAGNNQRGQIFCLRTTQMSQMRQKADQDRIHCNKVLGKCLISAILVAKEVRRSCRVQMEL